MLRKIYRNTIVFYTAILLYLMLFGFGRVQFEDNVVRLSPILSTITFVEKSILYGRYKMLFINILGNIVMFMPFGFLGWFFPKLSDFKTLLLKFLSVLVIVEALQYFSRLGVFDVDDILLNTLGLALGFWLKTKLEKHFV